MEKVKGFFSSTVEPLLPVSAPAEGEGAGAAAAGDEQEGEGGSEGGSSMFSSYVRISCCVHACARSWEHPARQDPHASISSLQGSY